MNNQEKVWDGDVIMKYPKQWIVFVDSEYDKETNKYMGRVHLVTPSKKEAYAEAMRIGDSMGVNGVLEGFNDTREISSIWRE